MLTLYVTSDFWYCVRLDIDDQRMVVARFRSYKKARNFCSKFLVMLPMLSFYDEVMMF